MIPTYKFSKKERKKFKEWLNSQVITHPTSELLEIYEKRILLDHSYLRAEKYDSPEHQQELKEIQKKEDNRQVPRNQQNPNFDQLMNHLDQVQSSKTFQEIINHLNEMRNFIHHFNFRKYSLDQPYQPHFLNLKKDELDPRLFEQEPYFDHYLNYLLTQYQYKIHDQEFQIFLKLTNEQFNDESSQECLEALRESKSNSEEYEEIANQIFEAINNPLANQYQITSPKEMDPLNYQLDPKNFTTLQDFLNYLYISLT